MNNRFDRMHYGTWQLAVLMLFLVLLDNVKLLSTVFIPVYSGTKVIKKSTKNVKVTVENKVAHFYGPPCRTFI